MPGTTIGAMRFPVVLFDLDGTLIDSGPMIVASMKHATLSVLGREVPEEVLTAAVGGPGLVAQMHALAPDRVDDLVAAYREHNEPLHEELEAFWEVVEVLPRLRDEGRRLGIVTAKRRATVQLAFDRLPGLEDDLRRRRSRPTTPSGTSRRPTRSWPRSTGSVRRRPTPPTSATRRTTSAPPRRRAPMPSPSPGAASTATRCSSARSRTRSCGTRRSCLASSRAAAARAAELRETLTQGARRLPRRGRADHVGRRVRPALRRAGRARGASTRASSRPTLRPSASARRPPTASRRCGTSSRWARSRRSRPTRRWPSGPRTSASGSAPTSPSPT